MPDKSPAVEVIDVDDGDEAVASAPSEQSSEQLTVPELEMSMDKFAPSMTVVGPDRKKFKVSTTAAANRARAQVIAGRLSTVLEHTLDELDNDGSGVDLLTLKRVTAIAKLIQEMNVLAYESPKTKGLAGSEFEQFALGAVKAAASGVADGITGNFNERMAKIKRLGKSRKPKKVEAINVTEPDDAA